MSNKTKRNAAINASSIRGKLCARCHCSVLGGRNSSTSIDLQRIRMTKDTMKSEQKIVDFVYSNACWSWQEKRMWRMEKWRSGEPAVVRIEAKTLEIYISFVNKDVWQFCTDCLRQPSVKLPTDSLSPWPAIWYPKLFPCRSSQSSIIIAAGCTRWTLPCHFHIS